MRPAEIAEQASAAAIIATAAMITISGGTVDATGGKSGAGIGGGIDGSGGLITISGGTVNAVSKALGAGIGGGKEGYGGIIKILGGTVYALSEDPQEVIDKLSVNNVSKHSPELYISQSEFSQSIAAAGIGNGEKEAEQVFSEYVTNRSADSEITISGGLVYAGGPQGDIGPGALILISGGSAVFLKNDLVRRKPHRSLQTVMYIKHRQTRTTLLFLMKILYTG